MEKKEKPDSGGGRLWIARGSREQALFSEDALIVKEPAMIIIAGP
jgi:hypothetical protein